MLIKETKQGFSQIESFLKKDEIFEKPRKTLQQKFKLGVLNYGLLNLNIR